MGISFKNAWFVVYNYRVEKIKVLGIPVNKLTFSAALEEIGNMIAAGTPHQIVTVNAEFLVIAQEDEKFKTI